MVDSRPRISVVMGVYNGERYLREAVDSVLGQTFGDFEFIIINDGSTDGTADILESYEDRRIRLVHQQNMGLTPSLNKGLRMARGEYVARHDADDVSHSERFEKQLDLFARRPELTLVASRTRTLENGTEDLHVPEYRDDTLPAQLLQSSLFTHGSMTFRRAAVMDAGGYDERFVYAQDRDLWLRMAWAGHLFGTVQEPLYLFRRHDQQIRATRRSEQMQYGLRASLRMIGRIVENPDACNGVDRRALHQALNGVAGECLKRKRPDGARLAARAMIAVWPGSALGYKLYALSLPGLRQLRSALRPANSAAQPF